MSLLPISDHTWYYIASGRANVARGVVTLHAEVAIDHPTRRTVYRIMDPEACEQVGRMYQSRNAALNALAKMAAQAERLNQ